MSQIRERERVKSVQFSVNLAKVGSTCPQCLDPMLYEDRDNYTAAAFNDFAPSVLAQHFIPSLVRLSGEAWSKLERNTEHET